MNLETKMRFDMACKVLKLSPRTQQETWDNATALGLNLDDPTIIFLALNGSLDQIFSVYAAEAARLPTRMEYEVSRAISKAERMFEKQLQIAVERSASETGRQIASKFVVSSKASALKSGLGVSAICGAIALAISSFACVLGWYLGSRQATHLWGEWNAILQRADIARWVGLIGANSDLSETMAQACAVGSEHVFRSAGKLACKVPLWIEGTGVGTTPDDGLWGVVAWWLRSSSPFAIFLVGLLAGIASATVVTSVRRHWFHESEDA